MNTLKKNNLDFIDLADQVIEQEMPDIPGSEGFSIYNGISSKEELDHLLKTKPNLYHNFIFEKMDSNYVPSGRIEKHHIIPKHCGGKDEPCNILRLSFADHTQAPKLLAKVFKSEKDNYVVLWRSGLTEEARQKQREYECTQHI